jgi:hypothetical protein
MAGAVLGSAAADKPRTAGLGKKFGPGVPPDMAEMHVPDTPSSIYLRLLRRMPYLRCCQRVRRPD